ncbi:MAG: hypothetical protein UX57_C0016G0019 [Candidatus Uhrbacteria bacterium GW2011_GWE2_46_68]|uniref:Uncharacterized protein n=2 Tax=Candidatus Uhriibacteriota TaxID=1752732 RepID=A0A0G1Q5Z9_9BACT|nr:MAG: hypothetical protein UX45_C0017G0019 [Candidatus Uhrbacteria bacterium GW2011_GWF2_46_218]KKU40486.1 MAG: hypothetical protein UX57_C0016G0019 [Candidatus Uhrbacteria bacterium GW2011_GWE2_46_68]
MTLFFLVLKVLSMLRYSHHINPTKDHLSEMFSDINQLSEIVKNLSLFIF